MCHDLVVQLCYVCIAVCMMNHVTGTQTNPVPISFRVRVIDCYSFFVLCVFWISRNVGYCILHAHLLASHLTCFEESHSSPNEVPKICRSCFFVVFSVGYCDQFKYRICILTCSPFSPRNLVSLIDFWKILFFVKWSPLTYSSFFFRLR